MMRDLEIGHHSSVARATLGLVCGYCFLLRGVRSKVPPSVRRMRAVREGFYVTMWRSSAEAVGARFNSLPDGTAEIQRGGRLLKVCSNRTSLDDGATLDRAGDKLLVYGLLARFGIPVPRHIVIGIGEFEKALHMLRSSSVPLVVKPAANTGGGAGVSTNVMSPRGLKAAVAWARAYGSRILVQEQVEGDCYRVLVMDGEVLDTVVRHPPSVIGDQLSTVRQLVRHENKLRREEGVARAQGLIRLDPDLRNTLSSQGLNLDSRPAKGEVVVLKRVINDNGTCQNAPANGCLSPAILESACKAADVVGVRLAGVDLICRDPGVPLDRSGGAIIEVNTNPGLYYHYRATDSRFPVAEQVLSRFFNATTVRQRGEANGCIPQDPSEANL